MPYLFFALLGYLSGSILYSRLLPAIFRGADIVQISEDGNPGVANVFMHFGPALGIPCLFLDILKGTLPVALGMHCLDWSDPLFSLVLVAPVLGHARRGKAIAVSFGSLIGLMPESFMVIYLAIPFVVFSTLIRINPHAWRAILSFLCFLGGVFTRVEMLSLRLGAFFITLTVMARHFLALRGKQEKPHIDRGWDFSMLRRH